MNLEPSIEGGAQSSGAHAAAAKMPVRLGARTEIFTRLVRHEFLTVSILVIAASFVVVAPMLILGTVSGRDFPFHLTSWMDVARQWHHGTIYPQWAEYANWGFGEPRFIFYPPGSWMLGAALGSLLPWKIVPIAFVWLVLIGAGLSMFVLARDAMPWQQAALAAMLYAANPYHLLLVYYRSDFAELLASAFFPLLPWGVMRIVRGNWRPVSVVALVVALIWLSNAPAAVIAMYSLAFLIFVAYAVGRDRRVLVYGAFATAGGLGLAAFYILPAAHQRAWVQINQVLTDGLRPEQNFLFSRARSMAVNTDFNIKISCVVLLMAVVIGASAFYIYKSAAIPRVQYWLVAGLGAMSLFMMFTFSKPVWALAPELHFVQFPWRYAVPFGVSFAFFLGATAGKFRGLATLAVCLFVLAGPLAKVLLAKARPSSWNGAEVSQYLRNFDSGTGYRGTPEYLPNGANSVVSSEQAGMQVGIVSGSGESAITRASGGAKTFRIQSGGVRQIALNLFDYPIWQADVDGSRVSKRQDQDGRVVMAVPAGSHVMRVLLERQWDVKLGIALSLVTAVLLCGLTVVARKQIELPTQQEETKREYAFPPATAPALPMENNERS